MRLLNLIIFIAISFATFAFSSCNQNDKTGNKEKALTEKGVTPDSTKTATDSLAIMKQGPGNSTKGDLDFLKTLDGKYPYQVKLLENPSLQNRLKNLLGKRFTFLKETWAVENPIEIKNKIFVATGCQTHNCGSTNFIIVVDLAKNILYAGIREEEKVKTYSEDGSIPQQLNEWAKNK